MRCESLYAVEHIGISTKSDARQNLDSSCPVRRFEVTIGVVVS